MLLIDGALKVAMKKEMTAFDVAAITSEMQGLAGGFLDKIFHWDGRNVLLRINVQGEGKKELMLKDGRWLHLVADRPETPDTRPASPCTSARRLLHAHRIPYRRGSSTASSPGPATAMAPSDHFRADRRREPHRGQRREDHQRPGAEALEAS
jgi:hypothetical protein